jgi:hypothetical protein
LILNDYSFGVSSRIIKAACDLEAKWAFFGGMTRAAVLGIEEILTII